MATVLSFSTITGKPVHHVQIDGQPYVLRQPDDLPLASIIRAEALGTTVSAFAATVKQQQRLTVGESAALSAALDELCRMVLDAPDAIHEALGDAHRFAVVEVFTLLSAKTPAAAGSPTAAPQTRARTGNASSRGSRGSTAATRARGSKRSRTA